MPTSPRGVRFQSGQKDGHAHTVGFRADVGIGPYGKTVRFPTVGDDPQIVPLGTTPERPEKTYAAIPSPRRVRFQSGQKKRTHLSC